MYNKGKKNKSQLPILPALVFIPKNIPYWKDTDFY